MARELETLKNVRVVWLKGGDRAGEEIVLKVKRISRCERWSSELGNGPESLFLSRWRDVSDSGNLPEKLLSLRNKDLRLTKSER